MISSTPLRKSYNKRLNESIPFTPVELAPDDDNERRNRRSVYDVQRRLSNVPESNSNVSTDVDQIKNHIKMCQKLFIENKINNRNAWDMKVIDYINQYVSNNVIDSEGMVVAAMSLDVCVKVFGCRVDYLAHELTKLSSITHTASTNDEDNAGDENSLDETTTEKRNKKKKKRLKATVAKETLSTLLNDVPKIASTHFTGSIDVYANNFDNMFMKKIPMDHAVYKFNLLNNDECGFMSYNILEPPVQQNSFLPLIPNFSSFTICPEFRNFHVDENDPEYNDSIANMINDDTASKIHSLVANEVVYDEDGIPVPELEGSMHDIFADNGNLVDDDVEEEHAVAVQATPKRIEIVTSFCPSDRPTHTDTRSTLSNTFLETVWVGPSHWKNKLIRPTAPRYSGKNDEKAPQQKKRSIVRQKNLMINLGDIVEVDLNKKCITRKTQSNNIKKVTLPPNLLTVIPEFDKLMLLDIVPKHEYQAENESQFEHSPYDYNNADDSQYCSQIGLPDVNDDPEEDIDQNGINQEDVPNRTAGRDNFDNCFSTTNLIDAPDTVIQTYIPYAVRAKKVNMKKMKKAMLKCLAKDNNIKDNSIQMDVNKELRVEPIEFSTVFKMLPLKLPKKVRGEISVHLAFFSLLHLTNEYNLELHEFKSLNDIRISKTS